MKTEIRKSVFDDVVKEYENKGFTAKENTISILKANIMALVVSGPIAIIGDFIYNKIYPLSKFEYSLINSIIFMLLIIISIFIHELLHGIGWKLGCKNKKNISYGVIWKKLTPYCSCSEPLSFSKYLIGLLMPFFILGIMPLIISICIENKLLMYISIINILGAGGDLSIAIYLFKYRYSIIMDHPIKCGFIAFDK